MTPHRLERRRKLRQEQRRDKRLHRLRAKNRELLKRVAALESDYAALAATVDMLKGLSELEADIEAFTPP